MASCKPVTKKVINSAETCVDDNLRGVVALCPKLHLHPKHRVVTYRRKDDSGRVAILGGGGSGHEPFASGFIGAGMLDGAVAGGVFASPPTGNVLYAIAQLYKYNSGGVLVLLGNYTGDRLNFGKAFEKAKIAGIKVEGFIVGEDVASSHNKTGGRSMCGEVFLYKGSFYQTGTTGNGKYAGETGRSAASWMCGAMSAKGHDLMSIRDMAAEVNSNMATLGVCLSACSLPGQPPLFETAPDELELGAGVHGEAGIHKLKMGTAKQTVTLILDKIIEHLQLNAGNRVAAMINNFGGTSLMEMNIIAAEIKDYLDEKQITLERMYSGHLKTSLEMHGFQICVLHLNKEHGDAWLELMDAPTEALGWTGGLMSVGVSDGVHGDDDTLLQADGRKAISGPCLTTSEQALLRGSLLAAAEDLVSHEELLNRLDSGCGDGDCGITLKRFGKAILSYLDAASLQYPSNVLWELSELAETDMGGTSGGIYSLGLAAASQAIASARTNDRQTWLCAWESAMHAITKYGGAEPGDRTMLDTLHTACTAFKENLSLDLRAALQRTDDAAERGSKATANMIARAGRASYVASGYTNDEDAGARAAAVWLHAVCTYIRTHC